MSRSKQPVIVSGHYDFVVRVWDLLSRKQLYTLEVRVAGYWWTNGGVR